ncbi:MAG: carbon-nitrogen hydrolase family protein [Planctomycetota bacterium]|nr:carbon-nitrogen hydrolase family protein [Planctomycetota bacterium]
MRIAVHQPAPTEDVAEAVATLQDALRDAERHAVDLVCFPECYIGGYFPNDREATARAAYALESAAFEALLEAIGHFEATLVVGLAETRGPNLFNTALAIRHGEVVCRYAKARPNEAFFEPGDAFPTFDVAGRRIGINICNDANFPEVAAATRAAGAEGIVMPLNNLLRRQVAEAWRPRHLGNLVARARETGSWIASSDIVGETPARIAYGCAAVVSAAGDVLARVPEGALGSTRCDLP